MENIVNELVDTFDDIKWKIDQIDFISCDIASELCNCIEKMDGLLDKLWGVKEQLKFIDPKLFEIKKLLELGINIRSIDFKYNIVHVMTKEDLEIAANFYNEEIRHYEDEENWEEEWRDGWDTFATDNGIIFTW